MSRAWRILGGWLFRARSFTPLPMAYVVLRLSWKSHVYPGPGGAEVDAALNVLGLALCGVGSLVRVVTVASVPRGTSLQSRTMQTAALNSTGPYAVVRHPLYFGNGLMVLGLLCVLHAAWGWALGLPLFFLTTAAIVSAEEALLREKWGAEFEAWARAVPVLVPRLSGLRALSGPFGWRRAIQREVNPFVAWGCAATLLLTWEWFARNQLPSARGKVCVATLAALLVLLAANKVWKKLVPP